MGNPDKMSNDVNEYYKGRMTQETQDTMANLEKRREARSLEGILKSDPRYSEIFDNIRLRVENLEVFVAGLKEAGRDDKGADDIITQVNIQSELLETLEVNDETTDLKNRLMKLKEFAEESREQLQKAA